MRRVFRFLCCLLLCAAACLAGGVQAGVLSKSLLAQKFPLPYMVGEKDAELPVWPLFRQNATATELAGYVFESIDFAPVPGFSGVPLNLLVALDPKGNFIDVQVLSHHEPVFLDGLGEAPLFKFVEQYRGLSLKQNIAIDGRREHGNDAGNAHIDGVAKATASVRIINQSVLSAALKVARRKLGFSGARDPDQVARIKTEAMEAIALAQIESSGLAKHFVLHNRDVESAYRGSAGEGIDADALAHPDNNFIDLDVVYLSVPAAAAGLLNDRDKKRLAARLEDGDHAMLVAWSGRYGAVPDDFVPGTVSGRLVLSQAGLPFEMRDLNMELSLREGAPMRGKAMKVFRIIGQSGLDPSQPLDFTLHATRLKGMVYPEKINRDFSFSWKVPERYYTVPQQDGKAWWTAFRQQWTSLLPITTALALLYAALLRWRVLTADAQRFARFRAAFLAFTLVFIGWHAQGQLSIVNITSVIQAVREGRSLSFLLYDPVSLLLWVGLLPTFLLWGRGTFCGWLCPFGALQEFVAMAARKLRIPQVRVPARIDAKLKKSKYVVLAVIVASACFSSTLTDRLVELEPFKTAITLAFIRSWPFVAYAAALLALNAVVYKAFCRYLCPFGAGMAVLGRLRLQAWLPRRAECGKPCQTCRHRCDYGAIRRDGAIHYEECFQCMECVVVYQSDAQCAPLILEKKRARTIEISAA